LLEASGYVLATAQDGGAGRETGRFKTFVHILVNYVMQHAVELVLTLFVEARALPSATESCKGGDEVDCDKDPDNISTYHLE
jgi:hypothetical protein